MMGSMSAMPTTMAAPMAMPTMPVMQQPVMAAPLVQEQVVHRHELLALHPGRAQREREVEDEEAERDEQHELPLDVPRAKVVPDRDHAGPERQVEERERLRFDVGEKGRERLRRLVRQIEDETLRLLRRDQRQLILARFAASMANLAQLVDVGDVGVNVAELLEAQPPVTVAVRGGERSRRSLRQRGDISEGRPHLVPPL